MPVETALVAYLASALPTETIFEGPMPEETDGGSPICMHVAHYDSQEAEDRVMGASLSNNAGVWPCTVQVMTRDPVKANAYSRAYAAWLLLDNYGPGTLSGVLYHHIEADGEPVNLFKDQNERWRFAFNCTVRKARG